MSADLALAEAPLQILELDVDDLADVLRLERMEHDHVVDAIDELGPEMLADDFHDLRLHLLVVRSTRELLDTLAAQVRRHDDDRVAEVHGAALAVREPAVVEHLQQAR